MKLKQFPDSITIVIVILLLFVGLTWVVPSGEYQREYTYVIDKNFHAQTLKYPELKEIQHHFTNSKSTTYIGQNALQNSLSPLLQPAVWDKHKNLILQLSQSKKVVIPKTYAVTEANPQNLWDFLKAPIKGFEHAVLIIGFVFLVGGAFGIVNKTGAIEAGLSSVLRTSQKYPKYKSLVIPIVMTLFSVAGATFGMCEEVLVFILITIPLAISLGYDSVVGVSMPFVGAGAGFAGAFSNPFTVGIAQGISNVPLFSGWEYRLFVWFVLTGISIAYVMWYANKVAKKPNASSMYTIDQTREKNTDHQTKAFTLAHRFVLIALATTLTLLVIGVSNWHWYIEEISALFIGLGLLSALIGRVSAKNATDAFLAGAADMMTAAIVIALTNGLLAIATDGKIIDTILYALANTADGLPKAISIQVMFLFQGTLNFFMPSGSGQAALTMPIMAPLSDLLGISRQTAVLAFQLGDGLFNMIIPTSGVTMGILAIAKISFDKWFKWLLPLLLLLTAVSMLLLLPPVLGWVHF